MLLAATEQPIRCRDDLICHEFGNEAVVYDNASNSLYRLNETSYFIWKSWETSPDVEAVIQRLTEVFDVAQDRAREDVEAAVAEMLENGLMEQGADWL